MGSPIHLTINPSDDAPIYRQIVRQTRDLIASGRLVAGDVVPSQRKLAQQLVVSPLTVKKAYDELEREGLLETARGRGTFVAARAKPRAPEFMRETLRPLVRRLVREAHLAGLGSKAIADLIREERARMESQRKPQTRRRKSS